MRIHMIGIKGTGMTALAEILLAGEHQITGSDVPEHFFTDEVLADLGIKVFQRFAASHINRKIDQVIYSAAYDIKNLEIARATHLDITLLSYPQALGQLIAEHETIAVTGSHGKTTTTAMLGLIFREAKKKPTVIVGSRVPQFANRNALVGKSKILIVETCEYREHFLHYHPHDILITNIDWDHPDFFPDESSYFEAFRKFVANLSGDSTLVVSSEALAKLDLKTIFKNKSKPNIITFGFDDEDFVAKKIKYGTKTTTCEIHAHARFGLKSTKLTLPVLGRHNLANALAALAMAHVHVIDLKIATKSLAIFEGTTRRFELMGEKNGVSIIDDFAHHPTEVRAALAGAKQRFPKKRIVAIFQAHTYSRTAALLADFGTSFDDAKVVLIPEIFSSAREHSQEYKVSADILVTEIKKSSPRKKVIATGSLEETCEIAKKELKKGDVLILLGAGEQWQIGKWILEE